MDLLAHEKFRCSVSSVLNKDIKQHGKQFLYDQQDDTAWSSHEGMPQWVSIEFESPQTLKLLSLQFQGGFAAKRIKLQVLKFNQPGETDIYEECFYADDVNSMQNFVLATEQTNVKKVKLLFESSTDLFGRIIVYNLKFYG